MDPVAEYNRLIEAEPRSALEQAQALPDAFLRAGISFDGLPLRSFLRPHFVARAEWGALRAAARRVLEIAARVARSAFGGDLGRLCAFLGTPPEEAPWLAIDTGEADVVWSRLDAFATPLGPRFVEFNSDAPAGFGYGDRMARVFEGLPLFRAFAARRQVRYVSSADRLVEAIAALARRKGAAGTPRVAIVDWSEVKTRADQEILREGFEERGVRCWLADPRQLELRGGRLWAGGEAADLVFRRAVLSELVGRAGEVSGFFEAYRRRGDLFVNSFRCRLSEDKAFFALLTDEAFASLMSEEERALVARVLPWTRRVEERRTRKDGVEIELVPFVLEARPRLVLKPTHGYGGQSVLIGDETAPADWERAVRDALRGAWVVQERVPIGEEVFPVLAGDELGFERLKVNVNPFYVAGAEVGAVARASRSSVVNVSAGGGSVPTFVVG